LLVGAVVCGALSASAAEPREGDSGTLTGVVSEKGETWIRVKPAEGESMRFMPRWIGGMPKDGGGLDKDMLAKLAQVKVEDRVEVKWVFEERPRVVEIKVLAK
jgi:hypothetical protein